MGSRHELTSTYRGLLKKYFLRLDWQLLVFLILFLNVKLYIKVLAIILAVVVRGRPEWPKKPPLWWGFYVSMIALGLINLLLSASSLSLPAFYAFSLGCLYWVLAMLAAWQIFLFVQRGEKDRIHHTVSFFFLLNAGVMLISLLWICYQAGVLNPYNYEGEHRKYFISTGDRIMGIGLDSSVTAALISAFGLLYFLYKGKKGNTLLCFTTVLLATSNTVNYILAIILLLCFFFYSDRLQKSMILILFSIMIIFSAQVSPSNNRYASNLLSQMVGRRPYIPPMPIPSPNYKEFVEDKGMEDKEHRLQSFMSKTYSPGKIDSITHLYKGWDISGRRIAWKELTRFFKDHPMRIFLGSGMGNFSSRLALRTTGLGVEGAYPEKEKYIHPFFRDNYLFIYLYYHIRDEGQHSVINKPDSVYGQLLTEYGLIGLACFFIFYLAFFGRPLWRWGAARSYGLPLLLLMAGAFFTEYWFEQLSVVVLFELLMLLDKQDLRPSLRIIRSKRLNLMSHAP